MKYNFLTKIESFSKKLNVNWEKRKEKSEIRGVSGVSALPNEMKIKPFLFNWLGQFEKVKKTEMQLMQIFDKVTVINSDENHEQEHWINVGEESYFAKQFTTALAEFDGDVLFHIQGDATFDDWDGVVANAKKYFEKYNWGVYAPNVDYIWLNGQRVNLPSLSFEESKLSMVTNPDCTCWFIHKDIINLCRTLNIDLESSNKYGWGIDWIMCALSYQLGRPVIRDYEFCVFHPKHTGYNAKEANTDLSRLINSLDSDLQRIIYDLYRNDERLSDHFKNIISKPRKKLFGWI